MSRQLHRRLTCLTLALVTILLGLVLRFIPAGLPFLFVKYGGSVLWAAMVYLLLAALMPRKTPRSIAVLAGILVTAVELSRLYHAPVLDAFRLTLAGKLLLGRVFNPWHFLVYWISIVVTAFLDRSWIKHRMQ